MRKALAGALFALIASAPPAFAELLAHRAVYDLEMSRRGGDVQGGSGRIVYELRGDACEGFATSVRQATTLVGPDGVENTLDVSATTFETGEGDAFDFRAQTRANGNLVRNVEGRATRDGDRLSIALRAPREREIVAGPEPVMFPAQHLRAVVEAARAGSRILATPIFDGGDSGEELYDSLAVVGAELTEPFDSPFPELTEGRRWRATISYFDRAPVEGERTPVYVVSFALHENGVTSDMELDFGDFALRATMTSFESFPPAEGSVDCPPR